ncbi:hypothetical protein [Rossellomorea vietnamensis]|uniref:hypothetical protein n=1 Tax=Rossellomorea vietnamensis TaxID=218284 RepID=UPI0012DE4406|nr:hypothetical protein [Rossellomorea vietnamensis]
MSFDDLARENKKIENDKREKDLLLNEINRKLLTYQNQVEQYEDLPQYKENLKKVIDRTINEFINYFQEKEFSVTRNKDEVLVELKNINLTIRLNIDRSNKHFSLIGIKDGYAKFSSDGDFVEGNPYQKNSNIFLLVGNELHFMYSGKKNDVNYLSAEIEAIELDITKLRNRTREDFSIDFVLNWNEKETEHISIIEIIEGIEKEYF